MSGSFRDLKVFNIYFGISSLCITFATKLLRGGAVVARWAHNPKVGGSNPPSATKRKQLSL